MTSRERLGLAGERLVPVGPLALAEAEALFLERARAAGAEVAPSPELGRLLEALDRLPLAIELAAARAGLMPAADLLRRLERSLGALRSRRRDLPPRQATLQAAIAWSWELLTGWEQRALVQCAVFRGGFELDAAEALLALEDGDPLDAVESLVQASLLAPVPGPAPRWRLYESVRAFAREQLPDERPGAVARHRAHYVATCAPLARRLHREGGQEALARLAPEAENLLAVHRRALEVAPDDAARAALSLDRLWLLQGSHAPRLAAIEAALEAAVTDTGLRAELLGARATALRVSGRYREGLADLERGLSLARGAGERPIVAQLERLRADVLVILGELGAAREALEVAMEAAGDDWARAAVQGVRARLERLSGEHEAGARLARDAISQLRAVGNLSGEALMHEELALCLTDLGESELALKHIERSLAISRELGSEDLGAGHLKRGLILQQRWSAEGLMEAARGGAPPPLSTWHRRQAAEALQAAAVCHRRVGKAMEAAIVLGNLGAVCHASGELAAARAHLEAAVTALDRPASRRLCGWFTALWAVSAAADGALELSAALRRAAGERLAGDPSAAAMDALCGAALDAAAGDPPAARAPRAARADDPPQPLRAVGAAHMAAELLLGDLLRVAP